MRCLLTCLLVLLPLCAVAPLSAAHAADSCDTAGSQADLTQCYGDAYKKSDAMLNALYRQITGRLKGDASTTKLLVTSQRAWVAYRDAECDFKSSGVAGGSARPMIVAICLDDITQARIKDFQGFLKCHEGDMDCPVPPN